VGGALGVAGPKVLPQLAKGADHILGVISTRVGNINEGLKFKLREFEFNNLRRSHLALSAVDPFLVRLNKLPKDQQGRLERAILTGDPQATHRLLQEIGDPELIQEWGVVQETLKNVGSELASIKRIKERAGYFPRIVKDVPGLLEALGKDAREGLEKVLAEAEKHSLQHRKHGLTEVERSRVINDWLRRSPQGAKRPGYSRERGVEEITPELQKFYATPTESVHSYLRRAVEDIETQRFFGRHAVTQVRQGLEFLDSEASIGKLVGEMLQKKELTNAQADELGSILKARFNRHGDQWGLVGAVKNLTNAGLLGNVVSAGTQLGDAFMAAHIAGMKPTLTALVKKLTGRSDVNTRDFGLLDHISEEFVSTTRSAKFLNAMFKASGFSAVDKFGKDINLNANLSKYRGLAKSEKGQAKIREELGPAMGREVETLIRDLRSGQVTEPIRALLFSKLSDMQPISKSEVPQAYLENPNGRILYMLKTFAIKQGDIIRRDSYNEIRKGNVAKGLYNLGRYATLLGVSGATTDMIKDWIMGNDAKFLPSDIPENVFKTFGWAAWNRDLVASGKPEDIGKAVGNTVLPPWKVWAEVATGDPKAVKYVPLVGKLYYQHAMGGKEKQAEWERKKQERELRKLLEGKE
jgi:hypothetical protein